MAKEKESRFRSYHNPDSIRLINSAIATEQEEFNSFDVTAGRILIDRVTIIPFATPPTIIVQEGYDKEYMFAWNENVGRLLYNDIKRGRTELYYEITTSIVKALVRLVTDNDVKSTKLDNFDKIVYGGNEYVIIKIVSVDKTYGDMDINELTTESVDPRLLDELDTQNVEETEEGASYLSICDTEDVYNDFD